MPTTLLPATVFLKHTQYVFEIHVMSTLCAKQLQEGLRNFVQRNEMHVSGRIIFIALSIKVGKFKLSKICSKVDESLHCVAMLLVWYTLRGKTVHFKVYLK